MKQVLGITGSPRRNGNTHLLVTSMLKGARDAGAADEIIFLDTLKIRECDGCHVCWKGKSCSKQDDMNALYSRIIQCDVLILGTPVYWYGPTALMKGFIDRFVYFNCPENRIKIKNKAVLIAIPFEEDNISATAPLVDFFKMSIAYLEMNLLGMVLVPGVGSKGDILKKQDKLTEAYELGRKSVL